MIFRSQNRKRSTLKSNYLRNVDRRYHVRTQIEYISRAIKT
jgi:hypothetical protein